MANTRTLLLDFDGPVCSIFAGVPAHQVADELRNFMQARGLFAPQIDETDDPLHVLRLIADIGSDGLTRTAADFLRDAEVGAARSATPTPHLHGVLVSAIQTERQLGVVSNNSRAGVQAYLSRVGLERSFGCVIGRYDGMDPHQMKPSGHLVEIAIDALNAEPAYTTLVGDSVAAIQAAHAVGVRSIGYADKPGKRSALAEAGASAMVDSMDELAAALLLTPCRVPPVG